MGVWCRYRDEIDATHELFRDLQAVLLDATGSPWVMRWTRLPWSPRRRQLGVGAPEGPTTSKPRQLGKEIEQQLLLHTTDQQSYSMAIGAVVAGGSLVTGVILGFTLGRR